MKKIFSFLVSSLLLTTIGSPIALAADFYTAENILLTDEHADDVYIIAGNGSVNADVHGDLYILGGNVIVNGKVEEDLVVAGAKVTVNGDIGGDVRILGGQLSMFGNVGDDVLVGAGQFDLGKDSVIGGSMVTASGLLTLEGRVVENVKGTIGLFILSGNVDGNVSIIVEDNLSISESAKVGGDFEYSSFVESKIPEGVVGGAVSYNQFDKKVIEESVFYIVVLEKAFSYLSALIIMLLMVLFAPRTLQNSAASMKKDPFKSFVVGLFSLIAAIMGAIILMVSIIGIPLALIILASLLIVFYLAKIYVAAWLAGYVFKNKKNLSKKELLGRMVLMLVAYFLIGMIPYVGGLIGVVLFLIGVGGMVGTEVEYYRYLKGKKMV